MERRYQNFARFIVPTDPDRDTIVSKTKKIAINSTGLRQLKA
jgi:hypothetical protein